jgi:predicted acyl esterase
MRAIAGIVTAFSNAWVKRPTLDDQWKSLSFTEWIPNISAPMFLVSGWYDLFNAQQLREVELIQKHGQA